MPMTDTGGRKASPPTDGESGPSRDLPGQTRRVLQGLGAVLAGLVAMIVLSIATDLLLHETGVFPPPGRTMGNALFLLATTYRALYAVAGSYLAARLAPGRPMAYALAVGVVGLVLSIAGAAATWSRGPAFGPHWYALALIAISMPCAWTGGQLLVARRRDPGHRR
jgi:hypothetical protein